MTLPKWLIPVVAVVAAVAVGIAATLIGMTFAAPGETTYANPATEVVPVIAPVADDAPAFDGETLLVSEAIGSEEVAAGETPAIDPRIAEELRAIGESDDPGVGGAPIGVYGESSGESGDDSGDPCAPVEGEPEASCPDGLRSTILPLTAPPEPFYLAPSAVPLPYEEQPFDVPIVYCDRVDHADDALPIGIGTNAPASITVRYWPSDAPAEVLEFTLETSAADRAAWEAGLAADGSLTERWVRPQHCTIVPGLEEHVRYVAELTAIDVLDRIATQRWGFQLPDDRTMPPVRVFPFTDRALVVSAPHGVGNEVDIRAWEVQPGETAGCATPGSEQLPVLQDVARYDVSAEYLERNDYQPGFVYRTTGVFWVPEGITIAVCIRWFHPDRPSWDWDTALTQYEQVLQSPDRLVPVVTLEAVDLVRTVAAGSIVLRGATREGAQCGGWSGPEVDADTVELPDGDPPLLCDHDLLWGEGRASANGDVVIRAEVTQGEETTRNAVVLPLGRGACRGVCELPGESSYRVLLPTLQVSAGMCQGSFGPCDPPMRSTSAGSALVRVGWAQGNQNGQSEWVYGSPTSGRPDRPAADTPQMDTRVDLGPVATGTTNLVIGFELRVDRPVDYIVRLYGDCVTSGTISEVTGRIGRLEDRPTIRFGEVCRGTTYVAEVELVDDSGAVSTWGYRAGPGIWVGALYSTETATVGVNASYSVRIDSDPVYSAVSYLSPFDIELNGQDIVEGHDRCVPRELFERRNQLTEGLSLGDRVTIRVLATMMPAEGGSAGDEADCSAAYYDMSRTVEFETVVSLADLTSVEGVRITTPEGAELAVQIELRGFYG